MLIFETRAIATFVGVRSARCGSWTNAILNCAMKERRPLPSATIGTPVTQLDLETVIKASHAVSGEIVLGKLIETLLVIAVEHAGAERGLLFLFRDDEPRIEAEATIGSGKVEVTLRQALRTPT